MGRGNLISILTTPVSHIISAVIAIVTDLLSPPDLPSTIPIPPVYRLSFYVIFHLIAQYSYTSPPYSYFLNPKRPKLNLKTLNHFRIRTMLARLRVFSARGA